ncbi:MAG: hypothetical protein LBM05_00640 [Endomicrobium sp.]|jgi:hypothetical protein|nr:hypothetical protein [Endomicrobium sp.]
MKTQFNNNQINNWYGVAYFQGVVANTMKYDATIDGYTEYRDGDIISLKFADQSAKNAFTLNINGLGEKLFYVQNTDEATNISNANYDRFNTIYIYTFVFSYDVPEKTIDGITYSNGWVLLLAEYKNTINTVKLQGYRPIAGKAINGAKLCMTGLDNTSGLNNGNRRLYPFTLESSNSTTKTVSTDVWFDIDDVRIIWVNSSVTSGSYVNSGYCYDVKEITNMNYQLNSTPTAYADYYLVGSLIRDSNGIFRFKLSSASKTSWYCTNAQIGSHADETCYIYLGSCSNSSSSFSLSTYHPISIKKNGVVIPYYSSGVNQNNFAETHNSLVGNLNVPLNEGNTRMNFDPTQSNLFENTEFQYYCNNFKRVYVYITNRASVNLDSFDGFFNENIDVDVFFINKTNATITPFIVWDRPNTSYHFSTAGAHDFTDNSMVHLNIKTARAEYDIPTIFTINNFYHEYGI